MDVDSVCVDVLMISDFIEPRYSADGNVGLEDYVDPSFGTDIGGYSGFRGVSLPEQVEIEYRSLSPTHVDFDVAGSHLFFLTIFFIA